MPVPPALRPALDALPDAPGVYRFYNEAGDLLYVGKAKRLRARVRSYWSSRAADHRMVAHAPEIARIEWERTTGEAQAIEREGELIAALRPRYNVADREGRRSPYLRLTAGAYPALEVAYRGGGGEPVGPDDEVYGPYRTAAEAKRVLRAAERHLRVRTCAIDIAPAGGAIARACLIGELGRCLAPCLPGQGEAARAAYAAEVAHLRTFLRGDRVGTERALTEAMEAAAEREEFEAAARYRDQREALLRLPAAKLARPRRAAGPDRSSEALRARAATALADLAALLELPAAPARIACFDVATLGGEATTGACGVALDGVVVPGQERTYSLGDFDAPDDLRAHGAIAARVAAGIAAGRFTAPDLLLVDGGAPQVAAWSSAFAAAGVALPAAFGIAKGPDHLVRPDGRVVPADPRAPGLLLAGAVRDRAHRRANGLHRTRRVRALVPRRGTRR
jgi:excinuclease UvrABC nuclease subunit